LRSGRFATPRSSPRSISSPSSTAAMAAHRGRKGLGEQLTKDARSKRSSSDPGVLSPARTTDRAAQPQPRTTPSPFCFWFCVADGFASLLRQKQKQNGKRFTGSVCVCVCVITTTSLCKGSDSPVPRGGQRSQRRCRTAVRSTRPHALQAPSAAHHALQVSGQSSAVHVPLCRCVSCALCENLRAPHSVLLIEPHSLVVVLCLRHL
jgi:hypothetical protein